MSVRAVSAQAVSAHHDLALALGQQVEHRPPAARALPVLDTRRCNGRRVVADQLAERGPVFADRLVEQGRDTRYGLHCAR